MPRRTRKVPKLTASITRRFLPSGDVTINSVEKNVDWLNSLAESIPEHYGWRFRTAEAFALEVAELHKANASVATLNHLYWTDMLKECEAYSVIATWRSVELARGGITALNQNDLVCAALIARSGLEATAQFLNMSRKFSRTLDEISDAEFRNALVTSDELEGILLKTLFGSRISDDEIYKSTNILTVINKVAAIHGQSFLVDIYNQLSEVAHPNFFGHSLYLLSREKGARCGDEVRTIGVGKSLTGDQMTETILKALSWASGTHVTAFGLMRNTISQFLERPQMKMAKTALAGLH